MVPIRIEYDDDGDNMCGNQIQYNLSSFSWLLIAFYWTFQLVRWFMTIVFCLWFVFLNSQCLYLYHHIKWMELCDNAGFVIKTFYDNTNKRFVLFAYHRCYSLSLSFTDLLIICLPFCWIQVQLYSSFC